ncbi:MAG TPA: DUF4062 domain-containing protein [Thermoanaerobaculia bacterium]|nr:DUF4062 domain-containing protein [Thermoanaerobaculia bacterium]
MDKRYQVFVSSTYEDLEDERQEVMQALLELDCIPSGMELFPAANEDQWTLITKVIDDCDYYLVIVAGRYGSVGPSGQSFTEMEYRYAVEHCKPVIGFLRHDPGTLPGNRLERSEEGRTRLESFRTLVKERMCRFWDSAPDLGSKVSRSVVKLIKEHPAVGWVRGDIVAADAAMGEILRLRQHIDELERNLMTMRVSAPEGTGNLAQGQDTIAIRVTFSAIDEQAKELDHLLDLVPTVHYTHTETVTWDELFAVVSPLLLDELSDQDFKRAIDQFVGKRAILKLLKTKRLEGKKVTRFEVEAEDFQTIKIQLRALGLIAKSGKTHSIKDTLTYWALTPYGDTVMTRLRAISK